MNDNWQVTPVRTVRVPDDEWRAAQDAARERGEVLSQVLRAALRRYVKATARKAIAEDNQGGS
jgi:hypothetical protein